MRILVTGHRGYIGAVLVPILRDRGHEVFGLDTGYFDEHSFAGTEDGPKLELRDVSPETLRGIDAVVHLAALSNDPLGALDPVWTAEINQDASVALARAAKQAGVQRFVFSSSCSVYGAADEATLLDENSVCRPLTAYARSKALVEDALDGLAGGGFAPVSLRHATAHGLSPRLRLDLVLNNFVGWACAAGEIRLASDGQAFRPMVHVRDIAAAFLAALEAPAFAIAGQRFNVGTNAENFRILDLAEAVREATPGVRIEVGSGLPRDSRSYRVSFDKIRHQLPEFVPQWDVRRSAAELYRALSPCGLDRAALQSRRFVRVAQIEHLLADGSLDRELRWRSKVCL
jgi:nucleoside-diphosphate-sugar epimerase